MSLSDLETPASAQHGGPTKFVRSSSRELSSETPTLKKADLADALFDHVGLNKREAKDMVEALFEVICDALESGESVKLSGFRNFRLRDKAQRPGRDPKTGDLFRMHALKPIDEASGWTARHRPRPDRRCRAIV
jgi:integration host factor subunit alpha